MDFAVKIKKIVIACDSFKGCLSSAGVNAAVAAGVACSAPDVETVCISVADGGEGTLDAFLHEAGIHVAEVEVAGPSGRSVTARYLISGDGESAVLEMAQASGLTLSGKDMRNPLSASTYGTGQMIADALARGCRRFLIGLGGSATNDGGAGALSALGFVFTDGCGRSIERPCGADLERIAGIDVSGADPRLAGVRFTLACDVKNPFTGPDGATYVFAPQKGAGAAEADRLERGMKNLSAVYARVFGCDLNGYPGAGAAGGLAGGLVAALNGVIVSGIDVVLDAAGFDPALDGASLVITGEGRLDRQTDMGKVPSGVLSRAAARDIPVVAVGGAVEDAVALNKAGFVAAVCVQQSPVALADAMNPELAAENIRTAVSQLVRVLVL